MQIQNYRIDEIAGRSRIVDISGNLHESETGFTPFYDARLAARRPKFIQGAIACREAVLTPKDGLGLSSELRNAVALRVIRASGAGKLASGFAAPTDADLVLLAEGKLPHAEALRALALHADMIAMDPAMAGDADLVKLQDAGYSVPQIIAISELLAYACYCVRIQAGFDLLEASA